MKPALGLFLGVSICATMVACDNGGSDADSGGTGPVAVTAGTSGSGGTGMLAEGVPLTATDGWVDGAGNTLMVQGAMFAYGDPTSKMGMEEDFVGTHACIKGTAAKVDMTSMACSTKMFTFPATDCYGEYWGAAIGLNLNQPIDPVTMMGVDPPLAFDGSAIKGFAFTITGASVPTSLRFKVEDASGEFCSPASSPVKLGDNTLMLTELIKECWKPTATAANADGAKAGMVKIAWQVVTNAMGAVPFDYCVENVRAITQ